MSKRKAYVIHAIDKSLVISDHPPFPFPVLGITTVAALFPEEEWEVEVVDEDQEPVDLDMEADLVGISSLTMNAPHAYELADHFRSRSIPVVMGGLHRAYLPPAAPHHPGPRPSAQQPAGGSPAATSAGSTRSPARRHQ